ncbi:MAG TPA: SRPBCC family protein [Labilithrix sp.]|nr:SRPBCC family protein [Labilithrix sp.]
MKTHLLVRETVIPRPRREVFAFFSDAGNLERITPRFLHFRIATPQPLEIETGTLIDYRLSLFGIPFRWRTLIEVFEPEQRFVDRQLKGPYSLWRHTHEFEDVPGGTRMTDRVEYAIPLGPLGALARVLFVKRMVEGIFDFRAETITEHFGATS